MFLAFRTKSSFCTSQLATRSPGSRLQHATAGPQFADLKREHASCGELAPSEMMLHHHSCYYARTASAAGVRCSGASHRALPLSTPRRTSITRAGTKNTGGYTWSLDDLVSAAVPAVAYATLLGYVAIYAPDQTPMRDAYFLEKLIGIGANDGVPIDTVFVSLFYLMGVYPIIFASLMIPSARCRKVCCCFTRDEARNILEACEPNW
jgi:hypothetical protein